MADAHRDGALTRHHIATGEDTGATGHQRFGDTDAAVVAELHPWQRPHEGRFGLLTQRHDQRVGGKRLEAPGRAWVTGFVEFHDLDP